MNMKQIEEKLKNILEERETIISELEQLQNVFNMKQQRLIELSGSIKTLQELLDVENNTSNDEK